MVGAPPQHAIFKRSARPEFGQNFRQARKNTKQKVPKFLGTFCLLFTV